MAPRFGSLRRELVEQVGRPSLTGSSAYSLRRKLVDNRAGPVPNWSSMAWASRRTPHDPRMRSASWLESCRPDAACAGAASAEGRAQLPAGLFVPTLDHY